MVEIEKRFLQIKVSEKDRDVHLYIRKDVQVDRFQPYTE